MTSSVRKSSGPMGSSTLAWMITGLVWPPFTPGILGRAADISLSRRGPDRTYGRRHGARLRHPRPRRGGPAGAVEHVGADGARGLPVRSDQQAPRRWQRSEL